MTKIGPASIIFQVVAKSEGGADFRHLVKGVIELVDIEVGNDEVFKFERGGHRLPAYLDHALQVGATACDVAHVVIDAVALEVSHRFAAPGTTGLDVEDGASFAHDESGEEEGGLVGREPGKVLLAQACGTGEEELQAQRSCAIPSAADVAVANGHKGLL